MTRRRLIRDQQETIDDLRRDMWTLTSQKWDEELRNRTLVREVEKLRWMVAQVTDGDEYVQEWLERQYEAFEKVGKP